MLTYGFITQLAFEVKTSYTSHPVTDDYGLNN